MSTMLPAGLVLTRAPAGCGKSTFAAELAASIGDPDAVISTDAIRARLCGSETDFTREAEVFSTRDRAVDARLRAGLPTIADSTNLTPKGVGRLIEIASSAGMPVAVVDCAVPFEVALERNSRRDRKVPYDVIRKQFDTYRAHGADGFHAAGVDLYCHRGDVSGWAPAGLAGSHLHGPFDVIGDVHGQLDTLMELLAELGYRNDWTHPEGRIPVFVGDIVDKGPDPVGVLDAVEWAHRRGRALMVRGNHEKKLVRTLAEADSAATTPKGRRRALLEAAKSANDGQAITLRALAEDVRCDTGFAPLVRWISRLPTQLVLDDANLVVVHAAIRPEHVGVTEFASNNARRKAEDWNLYGPSTGRRDANGFPERIDWVPDWDGSATVVRGHVTVPEPELRNHVASVDVGAGDGVALAAFRWPERTFVVVPVRAAAAVPA